MIQLAKNTQTNSLAGQIAGGLIRDPACNETHRQTHSLENFSGSLVSDTAYNKYTDELAEQICSVMQLVTKYTDRLTYWTDLQMVLSVI